MYARRLRSVFNSNETSGFMPDLQVFTFLGVINFLPDPLLAFN